jgi:protein-disulfide isomerase
VLYLGSLCLLCSGYYVCGLASLFLFWRYGIDRDARGFFARFGRFSWKHAVTYAVITAAGAYAMVLYHETREQAQLGGVAAKVVKEYYSLPIVHAPSIVSPYWVAKATAKFEDAPIRIVEYADFRCPDCLFLAQQLDKLKKEFAGKMNVAFQFFPLEAVCNTVVEKDLHPGACELVYIAAYDRSKFNAIYDDIWAGFQSGKSAEWRAALAQKYGVQAAAGDQATKDLVAKIINTGAEYDKTSAKFSHGIRSTPTMIINDRMVIGTLPYIQMQAIFRALVDEQATGPAKTFIENWEPRTKKK